jgi:hypothetical protein
LALNYRSSDDVIAHGFFQDAMGCMAHATVKQLKMIHRRKS